MNPANPSAAPFKVGDRVKCSLPGSWTDGKIGIVIRLNVTSSDGVHGHQLQMANSITVIEPQHLQLA